MNIDHSPGDRVPFMKAEAPAWGRPQRGPNRRCRRGNVPRDGDKLSGRARNRESHRGLEQRGALPGA